MRPRILRHAIKFLQTIDKGLRVHLCGGNVLRSPQQLDYSGYPISVTFTYYKTLKFQNMMGSVAWVASFSCHV